MHSILYDFTMENNENAPKKAPNILKKYTKRLRTDVWRAHEKYKLFEDGDKIMVCMSGGKDSYTMLDILMHFQKYSDVRFEIVAVNLDQKQPGFPEEVLPNYLSKLGIEYKIIEKDTYSVVKEVLKEGKTTCSLCSRLRRGTLYQAAKELGCNKIALGHHREDILETFFLNLFFAGKLEAMPAKFITNDNELQVIRPLAFCKEEEIIIYAKEKDFPIIPCNLCGSQPNMQRQLTKQLLNNWEKKFPNRKAIMFNALKNISPTHLLDTELYDFVNLQSLINGKEEEGEDIEKFF